MTFSIYYTQHDDTQSNTQHKGLICDTQLNDAQLNDTQHKGLICDTQHKIYST